MVDTTPTTVRSRRNLRWIAAGALAVCLGGLGAALLYVNTSNAISVVAINHTVYRDQVITSDDVKITSVAAPIGVDVVPAGDLESIIGKTALTDLTEGGLLNPRSVGDPVIAAGAVRVGLRLDPGRLPTQTLLPGTGVRLVPVAGDSGAPPSGGSVVAVVASLPQLQSDGATLLDVTVATADGERVAQLAAANQLAILQLPQAPK